jgi:hypothetical protein
MTTTSTSRSFVLLVITPASVNDWGRCFVPGGTSAAWRLSDQLAIDDQLRRALVYPEVVTGPRSLVHSL